MINFTNVSFAYQGNQGADVEGKTTLKNVNLQVGAGEFVLLCGKSGCGKSTMLNLINGLIPNHIEGALEGQVVVDGIEPKDVSVQELSAVVGSVFQNPKSQFFSLDTTDEVLFACSNHKVPRNEMLTRLRETTAEFNMAHLLNRQIFDLSGGEKQKIACASVYMNRPKVYVFDEPSANLDRVAIDELKQVLRTLKDDGNTIVIAEHRLYYLIDLCDRVVYVNEGEIAGHFTPEEFTAIPNQTRKEMGLRAIRKPMLEATGTAGGPDHQSAIHIKELSCAYKGYKALDINDLYLPKNKVVALVGHNGAGKSTFAASFSGIQRSAKGTVIDEQNLSRKERLKRTYMVMQDVNHQLFAESVLDELMLGYDIDDEAKTAEADRLLENLHLLDYRDQHPQRLSGGQKQRTSIATALITESRYLIFDEPTSGIDFGHMIRVANLISELRNRMALILVITHDLEFINACCDDVIELEDGKVVNQFSIDRS